MRNHRKPEPLCTCVSRRCLKCDGQFTSLGNRVCERCQKSNCSLGVLGGKYRPNSGRGKMVGD